MKRIKIFITIAAIAIVLPLMGQVQETEKTLTEKYRIITGVRVNPLVIYDLQGNAQEFMRLHAEVGALFHKRIYTSVGYTAVANAVYNFNEYWFIGFNHKVPVSWVIAGEYMITDKKLFLQTGPNIKISPIGNVFFFLFTPVGHLNLGLKAGVFIPLNVIIKKK